MTCFARKHLAAGALLCLIAATPSTANVAHAAENACRVVELSFTPTDNLQIVAWLEDTQGNYVDTVYITAATGTFGLGNRPGVANFNSGPDWPYGRREMTFPVWANRHGKEFPLLLFQNSSAIADTNDRNLSHPFDQSSRELHFCRPLGRHEPQWDTGSCASAAYTDKGKFAPALMSKYPPREDLTRASQDAMSVAQFAAMNPFDAVSNATPPGGVANMATWSIPSTLPNGDYVMFVEVSKEFDHNATYTPEANPGPTNIPWAEYGLPFIGQPSVVYRVPFAVNAQEQIAMTSEYAGYGSATGVDGTLNPPDATISVDVPGSGASRFALTIDGTDQYRVKVRARAENDTLAPGTPADLTAVDVAASTALIAFAAPGDDGALGKVAGYEVRIRAGEPITEANFATSMPVSVTMMPSEAGLTESIELSGLLPLTQYYVGIRAYDDCRNESALAVLPFTTTERVAGEVDACFVATAAWGSLMANDVEMLRHFRDTSLRKHALGELFVETYYTFGPAFGGVVDQSDVLRASARAALSPLVQKIKALSFGDFATR